MHPSRCLFSLRLSIKIFYAFVISPMTVTCLALHRIDSVIPIILTDEQANYKLQSSSLCSILWFPVITFLYSILSSTSCSDYPLNFFLSLLKANCPAFWWWEMKIYRMQLICIHSKTQLIISILWNFYIFCTVFMSLSSKFKLSGETKSDISFNCSPSWFSWTFLMAEFKSSIIC